MINPKTTSTMGMKLNSIEKEIETKKNENKKLNKIKVYISQN